MQPLTDMEYILKTRYRVHGMMRIGIKIKSSPNLIRFLNVSNIPEDDLVTVIDQFGTKSTVSYSRLLQAIHSYTTLYRFAKYHYGNLE